MKTLPATRTAEYGVRLTSPLVVRIAFVIVIAGVCLVSLVVSPSSRDVFRVPKEMVVRAEAILAVAVFIIAAIWNSLNVRMSRDDRWVLGLGALVIAWTVLTASVSVSRPLSFQAAAWVVALFVVFALTYVVAASTGLLLVDVAVGAAATNALLAILQEYSLWQPIYDEKTMREIGLWRHLFTTALIGNPNDLGVYLVAPVVAALAMVVIDRRRRILYVPLLVLLLAGLVTADSAAAFGALVAAVIAMLVVVTRRRIAILLIGVTLLLAIVAGVSSGSVRSKLRNLSRVRGGEVTAGAIDRALSNRLVPFLAAARMGFDHPLTGVGPGCFGREYYRYKLLVEADYPSLRGASTNFMNFHEAHNDHLQVLASTGIVGYACFLAAMVVVAWRSRGVKKVLKTDLRARFAVVAAFPMAVAFFVVTPAQFPLELASTSVMFLHFAACITAWSRHAAA